MKISNDKQWLMNKLKTLAKNQGQDISTKKWNKNYFLNNYKRYQFELDLIEHYYETGKILEIGSAPFHLTYLLKNKNFPIIGIDIELERFKQFISEQGLHVMKCDVESESLPFNNNEFKFVIFNEIFEHLRFNPIATLKEINRILKPDGVLILSTPNLYSIRNIINFLLGRGFDDPYQEFEKLYTLGHMGHIREYSVSQVKTFLRNTGFDSYEIIHKSYGSLKGLWAPFNIFRKLIPQFNTYQIHISKKLVDYNQLK